ncbi:VOC family protein [Isachenkonia alkalipeptolytica]|uniref:VOC family protein n=1 Tax=Isachenkonia alkalipeptolytica TaxID=2565777 RepID=A0AA43XJA0_9CLOT|nr:VOC family protein [Isachenkonia alkalipeptolytica]NBG87863.1 VOC family protein [Isachenkonia alkalipeptolytica]
MSIEVYMNFNGNCKEAVEYYAEIFETTEPEFMTFGEAPEDPLFHLPEDTKDRIMHVGLEIEGTVVMFSDALPDSPVNFGNNISPVVNTDDVKRIETLFHRIKQEGTVEMELQKTFWSKCYGSVVDKFGVMWQFNYYDEDENE